MSPSPDTNSQKTNQANANAVQVQATTSSSSKNTQHPNNTPDTNKDSLTKETTIINGIKTTITSTITSDLTATSANLANPGGSTKGQATPTTSSSTAAPSSPVPAGSSPLQSSATALTSTPTTKVSVGSATSSSTSSVTAISNGSVTGSAPNKDMPYTTGDLAGAIVGSLVGAAIITFLVTWFFASKRRDRKQSSRSHRGDDSSTLGRRSTNRQAPIAEKPISRSENVGMGWQAYLPQSADDRTIQGAVKTLFDQVELHVDNYYSKTSVQLSSGTREALSQVDSDKLPAPIDDLVTNGRTVLPVIKHCMANLLIERMSPSSTSSGSLLPAYMSVMPSKLHASSMPPGEAIAAQQAFSQWKLLNAYLHPRPEEDRNYLQRREYAADQVDDQLSAAFAPWQASVESAEALRQREKSLIVRAGSVGVLIMSQPSAYEFRWNAGQDSSRSTSTRSLIVMPGFWKTTDEQGRPLEQPQLLVSPVIVRV